MTEGRIRLYVYSEKIAHFLFTYEKGSKTYTLQLSGCSLNACLLMSDNV